MTAGAGRLGACAHGGMGDFVEVDAEVVRSTRSLVFMRGTCHANGRIIATCSGVWKIEAARAAAQGGSAT